MPIARPDDDDIGPLSLDDDDESAPVPDEPDDDEGEPLRHVSMGLAIVTFAMVTMVMSLAAATLISMRNMGRPEQFRGAWMTAASAAFWIATVVSLVGKLKIRFDRESFTEPQYLDWSLLAGVAPYFVLGSIIFLPFPGEALYVSMLGLPVSFLLFVRFLRSLAEQYYHSDLVRRATRLLRLSTSLTAIALFGFIFLWVEPVIGGLLVVAAYLAASVSAFWYVQLLVRMRRLI